MTTAHDPNPLLEPSPLDHGAPPFDRIRDEHFRPALLEGVRRRAQEVRAIATDGRAPTFENTVVALERAGELLSRAHAVFSSLCWAHTNPRLQEVERELAPELARAEDAIWLDAELFARVEAVHAARGELADAEDRRLVERVQREFVRRGARLDEAAKERLRELNAELSRVGTAFGERLLAETNALALVVEDAEELRGLSADEVAGAAAAAREAGHGSGYLVGLELPTSQGALERLEDRGTRRGLFEAASARGRRGGEHDTRELARRAARLRAERASLLGAASHAEHELADQMAGTPEAVRALFAGIVPRVARRLAEEERELREHLGRELPGAALEPWDWTKLREELRAERFDVDDDLVRAHFPLERVLVDGVFRAARELYGVELRERPDLPVYHPDVRVFEVVDEDGGMVGLFYGDYYARPSKRGGAWMTSFVEQSELLGTLPVVANVMNVPKPPPGRPALLSLDQVTTMFHEFGHAVHGLFSRVRYPRLSGTNVPRDFVEFPSQLHEDLALEPELLAHYARHHETGEPLPVELVERLRASRRFGQGFDSFEYAAAALLDLAWHSLPAGEEVDDAEAFERAALEREGLLHPLVPPRYRSSYFAHVFGGGYAAGYYAYLWSEALAADGYEGLRELGPLTRAAGRRAREEVLSRGSSREPMESYRAFRGRDLDPGPLLVRRGLA